MYTSPLATGNGAYVIHKILESKISGYKVTPYNPYQTLFPLFLFSHRHSPHTRLIHTTPDYAIFHRKTNLPLILTFHNYVLDPFMRGYSNLLQNIHYQTSLRFFTKLAVAKSDAITAVSHFTSEIAQRDLPLKKQIKVIYNGIDHTHFKPAKYEMTTRHSKTIRVLFCGNLTQRKGVQWLIPIIERLDKHITIAYTTGLRTRTVLPNHPQLECLGAIPHQTMPSIYQSSDILILPTVREGLPLSVMEAMACGLPVVATNCSSLPELIDEGKGGFLCPLGDVDAFAKKIQILADNILLRQEMGEYNRNRVEENFTVDKMIKQYTELFDNVLATRGIISGS